MKKRVVVVGGGVGGSVVAKKLEQEADVTLIDPYGSHAHFRSEETTTCTSLIYLYVYSSQLISSD